MNADEWTVHPNRFALGPDEPGRNGHFRTVTQPSPPVTVSKCVARVELPPDLAKIANPDGARTFGGDNWLFVACVARTFARTYLNSDVVPPFGFKDRGRWHWWDNTTTEESILEGPEGIEHIREYLTRLFPDFEITVSDNR